jgi:KipI family sensor histidine kinase inhibitor
LPEIRAASDRSLLVSFGGEISAETASRIARLTRALAGRSGVVNLHPAYVSVLVEFDPSRQSHREIEALVRAVLAGAEQERPDSYAPPLIEIPVRYGGEYGPDLEDVARHAGLSAERVVELHASATYRVHFLGFSPGFPYLGGLPPELATPRLAVPRKLVPAGSVAIGGSHTGIYPMDSPGGWRIIGCTALRLFDAGAASPALLAMGDLVRFVPAREGRA